MEKVNEVFFRSFFLEHDIGELMCGWGGENNILLPILFFVNSGKSFL